MHLGRWMWTHRGSSSNGKQNCSTLEGRQDDQVHWTAVNYRSQWAAEMLRVHKQCWAVFFLLREGCWTSQTWMYWGLRDLHSGRFTTDLCSRLNDGAPNISILVIPRPCEYIPYMAKKRLMIKLRIWNKEAIPRPRWPNIITVVIIRGRQEGSESDRRKRNIRNKRWVINFKDEEGSHKPRKARKVTIETTRSKEMGFPLRAARGNSPANTLTLAHWNWFGTSGLRNCTR